MIARLKAPGLLRGVLFIGLAIGVAYAIVLPIRALYDFKPLVDIEKAPAAEAMKVRVVGEQFTWTFFYKGQDGKEISSHRLYVPENQAIDFTVQSKDVIHDFWVPEFRQKIDAVPGITTKYRITPNRLGAYPVVCAELCGLGHSTMRQTVHVLPRAEFDSWMSRKVAQAGKPA